MLSAAKQDLHKEEVALSQVGCVAAPPALCPPPEAQLPAAPTCRKLQMIDPVLNHWFPWPHWELLGLPLPVGPQTQHGMPPQGAGPLGGQRPPSLLSPPQGSGSSGIFPLGVLEGELDAGAQGRHPHLPWWGYCGHRAAFPEHQQQQYLSPALQVQGAPVFSTTLPSAPPSFL